MHWTATNREVAPEPRTTEFRLYFKGRPANYSQVIDAWQHDKVFRQFFNDQLAGPPYYKAFRWETPPITMATLSRRFEFVLLDSPSLDRPVDAEAFAEHFSNSIDDIAWFPNIGGDATMIVPCPVGKLSMYGHLAAFASEAPLAQRDALWRSVGETLAAQLAHEPLWLSTAGAGVSWLHVRIDRQPKYYGYAPYRKWP
jgi:hypothetical protein